MNPFKAQIDVTDEVTQEVLDKIEFKRVWSGKLITVGDVVLYAFMEDIEEGEPVRRMFSLLKRELDEFKQFDIIGFENGTIPIFKR